MRMGPGGYYVRYGATVCCSHIPGCHKRPATLSGSVLAVLAVVGSSAGDSASGCRVVASWARGIWASGDAHSGIVGIYNVWAAVGAGMGCDVV